MSPPNQVLCFQIVQSYLCKKKLNRFSTSSALNQCCLDQRQVDLLQDSQTKIFIYRRICRFTQIYQPSGTVTASSGGFFCFASDSVTTPVIIRAQATILIVVTVSPKSSTADNAGNRLEGSQNSGSRSTDMLDAYLQQREGYHRTQQCKHSGNKPGLRRQSRQSQFTCSYAKDPHSDRRHQCYIKRNFKNRLIFQTAFIHINDIKSIRNAGSDR